MQLRNAARREGCPEQDRLIAYPCTVDSQGRNHTSLSIGFDHLLLGGRSLFVYCRHAPVPAVRFFNHVVLRAPNSSARSRTSPKRKVENGCPPTHAGIQRVCAAIPGLGQGLGAGVEDSMNHYFRTWRARSGGTWRRNENRKLRSP
jgi:hypothetical protein